LELCIILKSFYGKFSSNVYKDKEIFKELNNFLSFLLASYHIRNSEIVLFYGSISHVFGDQSYHVVFSLYLLIFILFLERSLMMYEISTLFKLQKFLDGKKVYNVIDLKNSKQVFRGVYF